MKLEYSITGPNTLRVKMGVKPASTTDLGLDDAYKAGIALTCDVTVKDLPLDFDLKSVPEVIMNHFVSSIKVDIQAPYRSNGKTKALYEKAYDVLKLKCANVQTHTITVEKSRAKSSKPEGALETLVKIYGKDRAMKHAMSIATDIINGMDGKSVLLKWAAMFEAEDLKKQK